MIISTEAQLKSLEIKNLPPIPAIFTSLTTTNGFLIKFKVAFM